MGFPYSSDTASDPTRMVVPQKWPFGLRFHGNELPFKQIETDV
jgi:hypothetical protein